MSPQVKLVCPVCGVTLSFYFMQRDGNEAHWALTHESDEHLKLAHQ